MILCHPQIDTLIDFSAEGIPSLVIEEPSFFCSVLMDLYAQKDGEEGVMILSEEGETLPIYTWVEIIDNPLRFELNRKPLLNRIASAMEKNAQSGELFLKTTAILQQLEQYIEELAFPLECDIVCERCSVGGLIKGVGIALRDEYDSPLERLIDYMELVREFDRDKLFAVINLRSFFSDGDVESFLDTVSAHGYRVLLMDCLDRKKLPQERRITIDNDLCEF